MPRYIEVDTVSFTSYDGKTYPVKDIRDISEQTLAFELNKLENDLLDEIASRKDVYKTDGEQQAWRIFDLNIVKLTEVNFDLTKIARLKIPL